MQTAVRNRGVVVQEIASCLACACSATMPCPDALSVNVRWLRLQVDPRLPAEQQDAMRRRMLAMTQQQQRLNGDRIAQQLSRAYQRVIGGKFS